MANIDVLFNGKTVVADDSMTILDLATREGIEIPTMCNDKRLDPYGSCFVCVVEVKGARTLVPACATKLRAGMEIQTNSDRVISSRKTALELIASNHYGDCVAPCKLTCPANCDVQGYVGLIANKKYKDALILIKETIPLPASIGRVCPKFCEEKCRRQLVEEPIAIDYLKRFVADMDLQSGSPYIPEKKPSIGKKVAVIGGGPAGLAASYYLAREGVDVEIFEAQDKLGGMLLYGIPQYRLPKDVLEKEINTILALGIKVNYNKKLGRDFTIDSLRNSGFDAIFLGFGAWKASRLGIPNDNVSGVFDGIEFLEKIAKKENVKLSGKVAIVGGGNTAFDCARTALRVGADRVTMIYRRTKEEMPANEVEKEEALEEGIEFMLLTAPLEVIEKDGKVKALKLQKMKLGEPDSSGRRSPIPVEGSEFIEDFDYIITAVGQGPDYSVLGDYKDKLTDGKKMKYDINTGVTPVDFIFAGGDCALGAKTVVEALGSSKRAVVSMLKYFRGEKIEYKKEFVSTREKSDGTIDKNYLSQFSKEKRNNPDILPPDIRKKNFNEIESVLTEEKALKEANRCMECGCMDVYECSLKKYGGDYEINEYKYEGQMNILPLDSSSKYLFRDPSKCVLCGRCIRLCSEKVKIGVYGYVERGFETFVSPEFRKNLIDSDCISCGLCISGCPVGAIVPNILQNKKVPLNPQKIEGICYHCSVGCPTITGVLTDSVYEVKEKMKYLCKKGRFNHPEFVKEEISDYSYLLKVKDADVYPSPSLSAEDYESLLYIASKNNWVVHNYYSSSSLLQAFSKADSVPSQSFSKLELNGNEIIVIAGDIENQNPTVINRLADIYKGNKIIYFNKENTKRIAKFLPIYIKTERDIAKFVTGENKIILLINPISLDEQFGFETSLNLYNELKKFGNIETSIFSEAKNIYSIIDAAKVSSEKMKNKIYVGTFDSKSGKGDISDYCITIVENGKVTNRIMYRNNFITDGTFFSSKGESYINVPLYKSKLKSLKEILGVESVKLRDIFSLEKEKISGDVIGVTFNFKDTFIERVSKKI